MPEGPCLFEASESRQDLRVDVGGGVEDAAGDAGLHQQTQVRRHHEIDERGAIDDDVLFLFARSHCPRPDGEGAVSVTI